MSTHLDDAVLSAFSLLAPGSTVVTVLAGFPPVGSLAGWDRETGAVDSHARVAERRDEDRAALADREVEVVHLDFADSQYVEEGFLPAPRPAEVVHALRDFGADEVFVPAGIGNRDHALVRDAALRAWPDAVLYADLPYALRDGWDLPAEVPRREPTELTLDAGTLAAKAAAFRRYETQVAMLERIFGDFVTEAGLGRERVWHPGA